VVHRSDCRVSAVAFGLRRYGEDQDRSCQRSNTRDERYCPWSSEMGRSDSAALARGKWNLISRENWEEDLRRETQRLVEDDRTESRDDADDRAQHEPLLGVGR
jgi:hypothetical protein